MPVSEVSWSADRFASLARVAAEGERNVQLDDGGKLARVVSEAHAALGDDFPDELLEQLEQRVGGGGQPGGAAAAGGPPPTLEPGPVQDLLKQRASLELRLTAEQTAKQELEKMIETERTDYKQAAESLNLQRAKIRELEETRSKLLTEVRVLEDKLRLQLNETEQVNLKYQKLAESRKTLGDQATTQTEQIQQLQNENAELRKAAEAARQDRDVAGAAALQQVATAESSTEDAAFVALWQQMEKAFPELITETHLANRQTFENVCDIFIELARSMIVIEGHVHGMLKDLRQVGETGDKLAQFHMMFAKNPNLLLTLRDHLTSKRRSANAVQLLRALNAWVRAFGSGLHKAVLRSPEMLAEELNFKKWPIKTGSWGEEQAIGKHFREVAQKAVPDRVGTNMRKEAADYAYQDYNAYMKRVR